MFVFPVCLALSVARCHSISSVPRYQLPPRRTQRAVFPHYAHLFASPQGLWDLSCWGSFRLQPPDLVVVEQLQVFVQPLPTPPRPAEALAFPSFHHMAPDLLFHPVLDEAEALARVSDREVIHPTAQRRVDQIDQPIHGLRSMPAEHTFEFPLQCRSFLELRCVMRTPDAPSTADAAEVEPQIAEAFAAAKIHGSTFLFIDLDL